MNVALLEAYDAAGDAATAACRKHDDLATKLDVTRTRLTPARERRLERRVELAAGRVDRAVRRLERILMQLPPFPPPGPGESWAERWLQANAAGLPLPSIDDFPASTPRKGVALGRRTGVAAKQALGAVP